MFILCSFKTNDVQVNTAFSWNVKKVTLLKKKSYSAITI